MDYTTLATPEVLATTIEALKARNFNPITVANSAEALEKIKELIPAGASITSGSSQTLEQIGYIELLKSGAHPWKNLKDAVVAESDPAKQAQLRNASLFADYYLGSVHAVSQTGELVIASGSGSQLPPITFTSKNIIFVVGTQKIAPTLDSTIARVRDYVYPLEDARMKSVGMGGSVLSKLLIFETEPAIMGKMVHVILVNEVLGF